MYTHASIDRYYRVDPSRRRSRARPFVFPNETRARARLHLHHHSSRSRTQPNQKEQATFRRVARRLSRVPALARSPLAARGGRCAPFGSPPRAVPDASTRASTERQPDRGRGPRARGGRAIRAVFRADAGDDARARRGAAPPRASGYKPSRHDPAIDFSTASRRPWFFIGCMCGKSYGCECTGRVVVVIASFSSVRDVLSRGRRRRGRRVVVVVVVVVIVERSSADSGRRKEARRRPEAFGLIRIWIWIGFESFPSRASVRSRDRASACGDAGRTCRGARCGGEGR